MRPFPMRKHSAQLIGLCSIQQHMPRRIDVLQRIILDVAIAVERLRVMWFPGRSYLLALLAAHLNQKPC